MPILSDYHLHSSFSGDSDTPMEEMVLSAIQKGLKYICFTEHMDIKYPYRPDMQDIYFEINTDSYLYDLLSYKKKYENQIRICFGVELGLQDCAVRDNAIYAKSHDFDFIIASTHVCNGRDPYYPDFYEGRPEEEAYREYFTSILNNIKKFNNFDVCGHLDYIVRYAPTKDRNYQYETYKDIIDNILSYLIENEKGIELNTGGLMKGLKDVHPCTAILKRYKELGGEIITIGSDSHTAEHIGSGFYQATQVLKDCGFGYYSVFDGRVAEYIKLL